MSSIKEWVTQELVNKFDFITFFRESNDAL